MCEDSLAARIEIVRATGGIGLADLLHDRLPGLQALLVASSAGRFRVPRTGRLRSVGRHFRVVADGVLRLGLDCWVMMFVDSRALEWKEMLARRTYPASCSARFNSRLVRMDTYLSHAFRILSAILHR